MYLGCSVLSVMELLTWNKSEMKNGNYMYLFCNRQKGSYQNGLPGCSFVFFGGGGEMGSMRHEVTFVFALSLKCKSWSKLKIFAFASVVFAWSSFIQGNGVATREVIINGFSRVGAALVKYCQYLTNTSWYLKASATHKEGKMH